MALESAPKVSYTSHEERYKSYKADSDILEDPLDRALAKMSQELAELAEYDERMEEILVRTKSKWKDFKAQAQNL